MTAFLAAGTRTFVDLTEPSELKHYEAIARNTAQSMGIDPLSLTFYRHPIRDVSVPKNPQERTQLLVLELVCSCCESGMPANERLRSQIPSAYAAVAGHSRSVRP